VPALVDDHGWVVEVVRGHGHWVLARKPIDTHCTHKKIYMHKSWSETNKFNLEIIFCLDRIKQHACIDVRTIRVLVCNTEVLERARIVGDGLLP